MTNIPLINNKSIDLDTCAWWLVSIDNSINNEDNTIEK